MAADPQLAEMRSVKNSARAAIVIGNEEQAAMSRAVGLEHQQAARLAVAHQVRKIARRAKRKNVSLARTRSWPAGTMR